jgi:pimeloyl-ACP methyl ester carboxylesterase
MKDNPDPLNSDKKPMPGVIIKHSGDILGAGRLTIDAIVGITDIVEGLHHAIINLGGEIQTLADVPEMADLKSTRRTHGITGLGYRSIRSISGLVGSGLDALISRLTASIDEPQTSAGRDAMVSVLNGVLGDHLKQSHNPLAITMSLRSDDKVLAPEDLSEFLRQANGRVAIFIHGLCMNEKQWQRRGHSHGEALFRDLGITPIYIRYNTGLHISENGRQLADILHTLVSQSADHTEFYIVAHSMGGLVSRSACYYAELSGQHWPGQLRKFVFLGTPHHGAMLERGGNWIDVILDSNPFSSPFARLAKIRSSGITDLRYGNIIDEDWNGRDRFVMAGDQRRLQALPEGVSCYAIAASAIGDGLLGDGLVTVASAFGQHQNSKFDLGFALENCWVGREINHMDLLSDANVYQTLLEFISRSESR